MKALLVALTLVATTGCIPEDITTAADVEAAVTQCELDGFAKTGTLRTCQLVALPVDNIVPALADYYY